MCRVVARSDGVERRVRPYLAVQSPDSELEVSILEKWYRRHFFPAFRLVVGVRDHV